MARAAAQFRRGAEAMMRFFGRLRDRSLSARIRTAFTRNFCLQCARWLPFFAESRTPRRPCTAWERYKPSFLVTRS